MLAVKLLVIAVISAAAGLTTRYFSPQELQDRFVDGQKLYALGDYEKAIPHFEAVLATQNNATINVDQVTVTLDDFILPVRVAATYQLGNTLNKLGQDKLRRAGFLRAEGKDEQADQRYEEALADFKTSLAYFAEISSRPDVDERTRVMAQFQTLETNYKLKEYEQVINEGERLLQRFPNSVYETAAYYNIGWSLFELEQYEKAIENFKQVITLSPRGSHSDRSYFQIAESYDKLKQYDQSLNYLDRLIRRYDFSAMSEKELIEMASQKLKGLVEETSRELVAKAQLKRGDILAERGDIDAALAAYAVVPEKYPTENALVQSAYIRAAELLYKARGTDAALVAYQNAIENVDDKRFQARTQLSIARLLFENESYVKAAEQYRIFLNAYGDVATRIGFAEDKVLFRIAQCYQALTRSYIAQGESTEAQGASAQAVKIYDELLAEHSDSELLPDIYFSLGYIRQLQKDDRAVEAYGYMVEKYPEHPAAPNALLQLARIDYENNDYAAAEQLYRRLLASYPESQLVNPGRLELGLSLKNLDKLPLAIETFEAIDPAWSQWAKVQAELADLYVRAGNKSAAKEVLARALESSDDDELRGQLLYVKSRIHFGEGEYDQAIAGFTQAMELPIRADIVNGALLSRGSAEYEQAKLLDARGDTAQARLRYEASLVDMKALLELDPAANIKDSAFRTLGAGMIRLQREDEAVRYYRELISASEDPQQSATFQMLLTELYFDQQQFEQAETFARELLEMSFEDDNSAGYYRKERAYSIIGNALIQRKDYEGASKILAAGLARYPNSGESANIAFSKAFAEFNQGEYAKAAAAFTFYVDTFSSDRNAVHGQYYLAHSYQMQTDFKRAAAAFNDLAKRYPDANYTEEAMFLVGENYYNQRDFSTAAAAYGELLESFPRGKYGDSALYALAWCKFEQEDMEAGMATMSRLVDEYPQSEFAAKAQFTVGDYHYNNRNYNQALSAYAQLIESYPASPEAPRAQLLVDELSEIEASLHYGRVMKDFEAKRYDRAIVGFREIIEKYPDTYTQLAAYCNLGLTYEILRKWPEAVEHYDQTLSKGRDDIENSDVVNFARLHRDWIVENRL
jgi:tetratricopeptide (TPR) repeat protein